MKKWHLILLVAVSNLLISANALADPQSELNKRLNKTVGFSINFSQKVISPDGEVVMDGKGSAQVLRPSLFRWHSSEPDDTLLVSDGKTVWYYSPFIEQVTILDQNQATEQTPFVLLTRNRSSDWNNYFIAQKGDNFTLTPNATDSNVGTFIIKISEKGVIEGFNVIEQDGQQSQFVFTDFKVSVPKSSTFTFKIPEGTEVDDQR